MCVSEPNEFPTEPPEECEMSRNVLLTEETITNNCCNVYVILELFLKCPMSLLCILAELVYVLLLGLFEFLVVCCRFQVLKRIQAKYFRTKEKMDPLLIERLRHKKPFNDNDEQDVIANLGDILLSKDEWFIVDSENEIVGMKGKHRASCLHIAILQEKVEVVEAILKKVPQKCLADVLHREADRALVKDLFGGFDVPDLKATLPLSLAVITGNQNVVNLLVRKGAQLDWADSHGYTVLHTIVLLSKYFRFRAKKMYDLIMQELIEPWWDETIRDLEKENDIKDNKKEIIDNPVMDPYYYLLNIKTERYKLTPLVLAAKIGSKAMLQQIMDTEYAYRFTLVDFGSCDIAYYDISNIYVDLVDHSPAPSVCRLLLTTENTDALECLDIPLLEDLLKFNWNNYYVHYWVAMIMYGSFMCLLTYTIHDYNLPNNGSDYTYGNGTSFLEALGHDGNWLNILILVGALYLGVVGVCSLISTIHVGFRQNFLANIQREVLIFLSTISISICIFLWYYNYWMAYRAQIFFKGFALIIGWSFGIFFLNGFHSTAMFSVMIENLLFGDMLKFAICYLLITFGFSSALRANMQMFTEDISDYSSLANTLFSLFMMTFGMLDTSVLLDRNNLPDSVLAFNICIIVLYNLLAGLFLVNLLIASMTTVYEDHAERSDLFWRRLRAHNVWLIEQRLFLFLRLFISEMRNQQVFFRVRTLVRGKKGEKDKLKIQVRRANMHKLLGKTLTRCYVED